MGMHRAHAHAGGQIIRLGDICLTSKILKDVRKSVRNPIVLTSDGKRLGPMGPMAQNDNSKKKKQKQKQKQKQKKKNKSK